MRARPIFVASCMLAAASLVQGASPTEGTRRMAAWLAEHAARNERDPDQFSNAERLELRLAQEPPAEPAARWDYDRSIALDLLYSGRTLEAVPRLKELWDRAGTAPRGLPPDFLPGLHERLAIGYLRLGEEQNCIHHHGTESCLLPIQGTGIHSEQRGSRAAIREYAAILRANPADLTSRWLMNVAYMTVGEYPGGVPAEWLIPPRVFESDHDIEKFWDVARRAGADVSGHAGGAILDDFDGDGYLDLFLSSMGLRDPLTFLHNRGDGTFEDRSAAMGLAGITGGLNAVHADYDNDGDLDVFVLRGAWLGEHGRLPDSLLRNRGDGSVRRRHGGGGPARVPSLADGRLGRLRQRRLDRPVRRQRDEHITSATPLRALSQQP